MPLVDDGRHQPVSKSLIFDSIHIEEPCAICFELWGDTEASRLRKEAFAERKLPDFWRVGQKVKFLCNKEWAWGAGTVAEIVEVLNPKTPADQYQVFWTATNPGKHAFWTTPDEVELVEDVEASHVGN